ncbi:MAG: hypothetical protein R2789_01970 [Microthrixaceae bacterium]
MKGIVWDGESAQLRDDVEVRDLRPGEVRVRLSAAGLCHSDVSVLDGTIMFPTQRFWVTRERARSWQPQMTCRR